MLRILVITLAILTAAPALADGHTVRDRVVGELIEDYHHTLKILAAYNAGPEPLAKWLANSAFPSEGERWVESLPYYETREYIPRVLSFRVIYEWLGSGPVTRISTWHGDIEAPLRRETTTVECTL